MARSKCGSCGSNSFELVEKPDIKNSQFKLMFVQCQSCGVVIGVTEYFNNGNMLEILDKKVRELEIVIHNIDNNIVLLSKIAKKK